MQTLSYWKQFEHTGRVEDYLSYASEDTFASVEALSLNGTETEGHEKAGANPYAGIHMGDGNDIEADAYRGIR